LEIFLDLVNYISHDEVVCNRVNLAIFVGGISSPKNFWEVEKKCLGD